LPDFVVISYTFCFICLDVPNGYLERFVDSVKRLRSLCPNHILIAGNVVTNEMVEELLINGADIVKVGIGSGSVCTTRKQTAIGYPQLSCVIECSNIAKALGGYILSDGGCTCPGDFSKAYGAGGDFVMSGGMFSGHTESAGNLIEKDNKKYKEFYGMSSSTAMNKYAGGVANYRTSEGKAVLVSYKGDVINTINDLLGGIRSTCTYVGASSLNELNKRTTFMRVTQQANEIYGKDNI
jgi:GMP reductase